MKRIMSLSLFSAIVFSGCADRDVKVKIIGKLEKIDRLENGCVLHINSGNIIIEAESRLEKDCKIIVGENVTLTLPFNQ